MHLEYILTLLNTPKLGRKSVNRIISKSEFQPSTIHELKDIIVEAHENYRRITVPTIDQLEVAQLDAIRTIEASTQAGVVIIHRGATHYPKRFEKISDPPVIIYTKGNIECLNHIRTIAIIGTREPTEYGLKCGESISRFFVENNFVVVSGLAKGCDTAAHRGCLIAAGRTIAFLGHGLQTIYPAENQALAEEILQKNGCLVSEYPIGTKAMPNYFVERDRLQAGISDGVFVIETGIKGGTMYAVKECLDQGKPIACLRHPEKYENHPKVLGNLKLISEGAIAAANSEGVQNFIAKYLLQQPDNEALRNQNAQAVQLDLFRKSNTGIIDLIIQCALLTAGQEDDYSSRELGPIHFIKYLYLADLAFSEYNNGKTYTGLNWKFHHYGPWATEAFNRIEPALSAIGAEKRTIPSDKFDGDFFRWKLVDDKLYDNLTSKLPLTITGTIQKYVHEFGADTAGLLNFVYQTTPMLNAAPGEYLNFPTVRPKSEESVSDSKTITCDHMSEKQLKRRKEQLKSLKGLLRQRLDTKIRKPKIEITPPRYDEIFFEGLKSLDTFEGAPIEESELKATFSEDVWKSNARFDPELS